MRAQQERSGSLFSYVSIEERIPASHPLGHGSGAGRSKVRLQMLDSHRPAENDGLAVSQFTIQGDLYCCIPDLVGCVNGLPLMAIEFSDNCNHHKATIPQLFWSHAFLIACNGTASRVASLSAGRDRFFEWKRITSEDEPRRLLDTVGNFIPFNDSKAGHGQPERLRLAQLPAVWQPNSAQTPSLNGLSVSTGFTNGLPSTDAGNGQHRNGIGGARG